MGIRFDQQIGLDADVHLTAGRVPRQIIDHACSCRAEVERLTPQFGACEPREIEQSVDELAHPLRGGPDPPERVASGVVESIAVVFLDALTESVDGPQRRAQVVRNRIAERFQFVIGGLELGGPGA